MASIVKDEKILTDFDCAQFLKVDLDDIIGKHPNNYLKRNKYCDFGPVVKAAQLQISEHNLSTLMVEFKEALVIYMI